jgi:hypothetical protein
MIQFDLVMSDAAVVVDGSGVTLTDASTGGDHTQTVVPGATYALSAKNVTDNTFHVGLGTITTAANILWVAAPGQTILIRVPDTADHVHYQSLVNGGIAYLRRLAVP